MLWASSFLERDVGPGDEVAVQSVTSPWAATEAHLIHFVEQVPAELGSTVPAKKKPGSGASALPGFSASHLVTEIALGLYRPVRANRFQRKSPGGTGLSFKLGNVAR